METYSDFANNTENDPIVPETIAYENGSSICQKGFRSFPGTLSNSSLLHIIKIWGLSIKK